MGSGDERVSPKHMRAAHHINVCTEEALSEESRDDRLYEAESGHFSRSGLVVEVTMSTCTVASVALSTN